MYKRTIAGTHTLVGIPIANTSTRIAFSSMNFDSHTTYSHIYIYMTMTNVQVSQSHGFNLNESGLAAWAVHMVRHFVERARREARHRRPAAIRHTQKFNHFTEHKNMIAARAAGVSHHGFRRRRGWGCAQHMVSHGHSSISQWALRRTERGALRWLPLRSRR
jgi:predicted deacetylase